MPGIYIKDSTIGPSISSALARVADNYSPKTQAEARLLGLQTEGEGWKNRDLSDRVTAKEQAARSVAGLLAGSAAGGSGAANRGAGYGTKQGDLGANQRGFDSSELTPLQKYLASRILNDAGVDEVRSGIDLDRQQLGLPTYATKEELVKQTGMTPILQQREQNTSDIKVGEEGRMTPIIRERGQDASATKIGEEQSMTPIIRERGQNAVQTEIGKEQSMTPIIKERGQNVVDTEIGKEQRMTPIIGGRAIDAANTDVEKARNMPADLSPGQTRFVDPANPSGRTLSGGSVYQQQADTASAAADVKAAEGGAEDFAGASHALENLRTSREIFNTHIVNSGPGGVISAAAQKAISDYTGVAVTDKAQAQLAIQKLINSQLGALARSENMQRVAGPEITVLMQQLPNGVMPAPVFNDLMSSMEAAAQMEQAAAHAKIEYQNSAKTPADAAAMRNKIAEIYRASPFDEIRRKYPNLLTTAPSSTPPPVAAPPPGGTGQSPQGGGFTIRAK